MIFLNLTKQEIELAAILLDLAADKFANFGCNDFEFPKTWTQEQCDDFTLAMHKWNGEHPEDHADGSRITMDWFAMAYLAAKLRELLGERCLDESQANKIYRMLKTLCFLSTNDTDSSTDKSGGIAK